MSKLMDDLLPFLTSDEIQKLVKNLARQLEFDYEGKDVVFICPPWFHSFGRRFDA